MGIEAIVRSEKFAGHGHMVMMPDGAMLQSHHTEIPGTNASHLLREVISKGEQALHDGDAVPTEILNATKHVEQEIILFWDAPQGEYITLFCVVLSLIILDAVISRKIVVRSQKAHAAMVLGWLFCGLGYNVLYAVRYGRRDGLDWFVGYALEWMLSLDNLFAFQFIMRTYCAPAEIQQKALLYGVLGSIVTRLMLFFAIGSLMRSIHYVQFAFGLILIYSGIKALHDDDDGNTDDIMFVRLLKRCLGSRLRGSYDLENHHLFVRDPEDGRLCATLMVPLISCVVAADVVFAVDSVSAKVAQIPNQYIAYSSSVLALLGLRAMFFVIDDLVKYFELLKYGVCFILVFIGAELMVSGKFQIPDWIVCMVIVSVFNVCIVVSLLQKLINSSPRKRAAADEAAGAGTNAGVAEEQGGVKEDEEEEREEFSAPSRRDSRLEDSAYIGVGTAVLRKDGQTSLEKSAPSELIDQEASESTTVTSGNQQSGSPIGDFAAAMTIPGADSAAGGR